MYLIVKFNHISNVFYEKFNNYILFINISMKLWMNFNKNKLFIKKLTIKTQLL